MIENEKITIKGTITKNDIKKTNKIKQLGTK
jgi:hypothetical protein